VIDYSALKFPGGPPLQAQTGRTAEAGDAKVASKINGLETRPVRIAAGTAVPKAGADSTAARDTLPGGAQDVQITSAARGLAALEQKLRDAPAIDEARVAAVRQKLDDGSYQVDPQRVADKLMRMERELNSGKNSK
jgi:negative regulator of flagellin synthesis FlgM